VTTTSWNPGRTRTEMITNQATLFLGLVNIYAHLLPPPQFFLYLKLKFMYPKDRPKCLLCLTITFLFIWHVRARPDMWNPWSWASGQELSVNYTLVKCYTGEHLHWMAEGQTWRRLGGWEHWSFHCRSCRENQAR
jgi:hypothetical protein